MLRNLFIALVAIAAVSIAAIPTDASARVLDTVADTVAVGVITAVAPIRMIMAPTTTHPRLMTAGALSA